MDSSANTTIQNSMNLIAFTLDYVQQILYWMGFDSCTLESLSLINDSQRRRTYNYELSRCDLYRYAVAIDFLKEPYTHIHMRQLPKLWCQMRADNLISPAMITLAVTCAQVPFYIAD